MIWPVLIIVTGAAVLAARAISRRQKRRALLPQNNETAPQPSDLLPIVHEEEAALQRGENGPENPVQETSGVPQNDLRDAVETAAAVPPPPENEGRPAESAHGARDETEIAEDRAAEPSVAPPPQPAEPSASPAGSETGDEVSCDVAEGGNEKAATAPETAEAIPVAQVLDETGGTEASADAVAAEHEGGAEDGREDRGTDGAASEEDESQADEAGRDEIEPGEGQKLGERARRPTTHRDRRGMRRSAPRPPAPEHTGPSRSGLPPAAASLRLALHAIRRTVSLSLVLSRPEGFPERIALLLDGGVEAGAYDETRYDDIDITWTSDLLAGELRFTSADGLRWVRGARRVHIFAADPSEPDLVSVSAARAGADYSRICKIEDVPAVCAIAQAAGSPELVAHDRWQGIPAGWSVLSGYRPAHAAGAISDAAFRPLDPGADVDISVGGGLALRPRVFAEGHPPRIEIRPLPESATVTIGGQPATQNAGGGWEAPGWDAPGQHVVDVVPGPSLTYEIESDPGNGDGWPFWNAHEELPRERSAWSRAQICGAVLQGAAGETVLAYETQSAMIALGASRGAVNLERRADANVSVGMMAEPPAFLVASTGLRRRQGRVIWLGENGATPSAPDDERADSAWVDAVYAASVRRLPLVGADRAGEAAWRRAVLRARKLRRRRR